MQGPSRLLNHSRFPNGRAHGFAAPLRVALGLWPKCPQGTRFPSRLAGVWGRAPKTCAAAQKASVASARRAQETRLAQPLPEYQRKRRGHPPPGGAAPPLFQKTLSFGKTRVSRVPSVARNARRALPPETPPSSRFFLHQAAFLASLRSLATLDGLCRRRRRRPPLIPASSRVSCSLRSLATLTAFAAAEVFGALPQTPARA